MKRIQTEKELTTGASQQSSCDLVCQSKYSTSIAPKLLKCKKNLQFNHFNVGSHNRNKWFTSEMLLLGLSSCCNAKNDLTILK